MSNELKTSSSDQASALKLEVHKAAIAAARITGWAALDRPALVAAFKGQVPRSTVYRWLAEIGDSDGSRPGIPI